MRRAFLGVVVVLAAIATGLFPATASAQEPPPLPPPASSGGTTATPSATATIDSVHLRNGGLYRGHVSEIVPGDHVTVNVEGGETKRVPWAEIDRVIVASTVIPPPLSSTSTTPASTPAQPAPMVGPLARVHISSPKSVILYRRPAGSSGWVQACSSPCNQELPIGDTYRITGNGVPATKEFRLETNPGATVDLTVDPASTGGMVGGGFLAGTGATAAYVGLFMALIGASNTNSCYDDLSGSSGYSGCSSSKDESLRNAGLITMAVGAAMTVGGILIFLNSAKTDIVQSSGKGESSKASSPPSSPPPRSLDAFLRQPMWKLSLIHI